MKRIGSGLLLAGLFTSVPIVAFAQTEPVVFEAESGALGANLTTGTVNGATYVNARSRLPDALSVSTS